MLRIEVVAGIIVRDIPGKERQVLLAKRSSQQHQGGLWEFPGGKVDTNEDHPSALKRELLEELGISILSCTFFQEILFDYSDKSVALYFYLVSNYSGKERGAEGQPLAWVNMTDLPNYRFPEANQPIVNSLMNGQYSL